MTLLPVERESLRGFVLLLAWVALLYALCSCATPVHLAGSCRAHEVGTVRFSGDCPTALCRPVDGGFAWVRVEDACR